MAFCQALLVVVLLELFVHCLVEDYTLQGALTHGAETLRGVVTHAAHISWAIDALRAIAAALVDAHNVVCRTLIGYGCTVEQAKAALMKLKGGAADA